MGGGWGVRRVWGGFFVGSFWGFLFMYFGQSGGILGTTDVGKYMLVYLKLFPLHCMKNHSFLLRPYFNSFVLYIDNGAMNTVSKIFSAFFLNIQ